jgi:hypothetical protein
VRFFAQLFLIALILPGAALGQGEAPSPTVTVEVVPREATVGDLLETTIALDLPEGWEAQLPEIDAELGPFSVISGSWSEEQPEGGGSRSVWSGRLSAYETGSLEIPSLAFPLGIGEESSTLESAPFEVTIVSTIDESETEQPDIADLKEPLSIPAEYARLIRAAAILALLLAAAAVAWWLHRRYARKLAAAAIPEDPFHRMAPHVWVYKALQELLDKRLEEQGLLDLFYSELSWILKRYAGGRYRLDLLEKTTAEIPDLLRQAGAPERAIQRISALLGSSDEVKFAKSKPGPEATRTAVESIYAIVDATKPAEAEESMPQKGAA